MINTLMPEGLLMDLAEALARGTDDDGLKAITSSGSVGACVWINFLLKTLFTESW